MRWSYQVRKLGSKADTRVWAEFSGSGTGLKCIIVLHGVSRWFNFFETRETATDARRLM